jgi:hypothetical protein
MPPDGPDWLTAAKGAVRRAASVRGQNTGAASKRSATVWR